MQVNWAYTHTHSHTCPQQCSWHPLTIRNWFGTSFCGRSCRCECECECECECFVLHRYYAWPESLFQFIVRWVFVSPVASRSKSKPKRKQTVQLLSRKWRRRSRRMHHAEPYYICRCSMWSCPSASTPLFPHCQLLSPLRRQCIHHLHGFFESQLFFSLSGNCDWWIDLLTRRQTNWIEQLTSWPFDRVTNWTDWQNADRLTPLWQSAVASLVQFRSTCPSVPSAFVRSISVKLYLMDFCAQTLQIIVTSSDSVEWGPPE